MSLNVLRNFPYSVHYYIFHPWKWIAQLFSNLRDAWARSTRGFAPIDCWNFNSYLLELFPPILRMLAEHGVSYPYDYKTRAEWVKHLTDMANRFEMLQEDNWEKRNEYNEMFYNNYEIVKHVDCTSSVIEKKDPEIDRLWKQRQEELNKEWVETLNTTMQTFTKNFRNYWD